MVTQEINNITFNVSEYRDFSFLSKYGKVFTVFDQNDSGNISFGISNGNQRYFVKIAGIKTQESSTESKQAVEVLKNAMKIYEKINHPSLIELVEHYEFDDLYVSVFKWVEGECLFDHWNFEKYSKNPKLKSPFTRYKELPIESRLASVNVVFDFLAYVESKDYVAVDFYDGSILYDFNKKKTYICDIDFFRKKPTYNDMGADFWGTKRLKSPEEYTFGATIDQVTNVFTLGALLFHFFGTYSGKEMKEMYKENKFIPCLLENWELDTQLYKVAFKAVEADREKRYNSISEFREIWSKTLNKN